MRAARLMGCMLLLAPLEAFGGDFIAPTSTATTLMRGGPGAYGAARAGDKLHVGVDLVANQSTGDRHAYKVVAARAGTIAYARLNGSATTGYGYTVIIDHGEGTYALYAHLAPIASSGWSVGQHINQGAIIGYMADLAAHEMSSGNVAACVVAPYDKIQLHFELFRAPKGRISTGGISSIKEGSTPVDPTATLRSLSYREYTPPTSTEKKKLEQQCSASTSIES